MKIAEPVQSEREASDAMTTVLIAEGHYVWRQRKTSRHCEEERRGNLLYFLFAVGWLQPNDYSTNFEP